MIPALITAGLSAASGLFASQSAAKANKKNRQMQIAADVANRDALDRTNLDNINLGKALLKTPVVTTNINRLSGRDIVDVQHSGGVHTAYSEWGDIDLGKMVTQAEASGFNPLTVLRAGGVGAYARRWSDTQTTDTTKIRTTTTYGRKETNTQEVSGAYAAQAYSLMSPQTFQMGTPQQSAVPSPMQAVTQGLADGFKVYNDGQIRSDNQDFQRELLNLSLDAAQKRSLVGGRRIGDVPGIVSIGSTTSNAGSGGLSSSKLGNRSLPSMLGMPTPITEAGDRKVTNYSGVGYGNVDPTQPDIAQAEDRLGDSAPAELEAWSRYFDDMWYHHTGLTKPERYQKWGKPVVDFFGGLATFKKADPNASWGITFK